MSSDRMRTCALNAANTEPPREAERSRRPRARQRLTVLPRPSSLQCEEEREAGALVASVHDGALRWLVDPLQMRNLQGAHGLNDGTQRGVAPAVLPKIL